VSAVTLTVRLIETPRMSRAERGTGHPQPQTRTAFTVEGCHSGAKVLLSASQETALDIVSTLSAGDVITATCWPETYERRHGSRVLYVESYTLHPRDDAA
jgi:hypothetical protein